MILFLRVLLAAGGLSALAAVAHASDYSNVCRTADGLYELDDGRLVSKVTSREAIPYETLRETVLATRRGYCESRGQRFPFEAKTSVIGIRFEDGGRTVETDAICELAADGLPAAFECEREVVTEETRPESGRTPGSAPGPAPSGPTLWSHNGSLMRLEADGAKRRFVYELPRRGMREAGAKPGDAVFEGRREGQAYAGTAYIFMRACGRVGYPVAGTVGAGDRSVDLKGAAPLLGPDCRRRGERADTLRFELIER